MTIYLAIALLGFGAGFFAVYRRQRQFERYWHTRLRLHLDTVEQTNQAHLQAVEQAVSTPLPQQPGQAEINRLYAEVAAQGCTVLVAAPRLATMIPQSPGRC